METLFTLSEAADRLRISRSLLYSLAGQGRLECFRVNRRILFSEKQLEDFLEASRHVVSAPATLRLAAVRTGQG